MKYFRIKSMEDYQVLLSDIEGNLNAHIEYGRSLLPIERVPFVVSGYSYTAEKWVDFRVDFSHSETREPNWRETVNCPETFFNNRMRASFQVFDMEMALVSGSKLYVTEKVTPIWRWFEGRFPNAVGSEYLGDSIPFGTVNDSGVRNEDMTRLTFDDEVFDAVVSFDVLEHIPDYERAFGEAFRVIRPGGKLFWSVPFEPLVYKNVVRARVVDGRVEHILPAEYHGNPVSEEGSLCFTTFGWEVLDSARRVGFENVYAVVMYSASFGYFGYPQFFFVATKPL